MFAIYPWMSTEEIIAGLEAEYDKNGLSEERQMILALARLVEKLLNGHPKIKAEI